MRIKKSDSKNIRILFMETVKELGEKVKETLITKYGLSEENFISANLTRFGNGEGKAKLTNSVRAKRFFIITDVSNNVIEYKAYGEKHKKMPDDHFTDIKRVISATSGNAEEITVIQTILYQGRQHKKSGRESLDCANALKELENLKVNCITTFDAHNVDVRQAIPMMPFDNIMPTKSMILQFIKDEEINFDNLLAISPDEGAMGRTRFYSGMLGCDIGLFYKRRDYSKIDDNGKNPIAEHIYLGKEIKDGEYLIIDDMISSGGSVIDILVKLKKKKPKKVWVMTTFSLFTEGIKEFDKAYKDGLLTRVYSTNLTNVPENVKSKPWFRSVDCSSLLAECLTTYINNDPISSILDGKKELYDKISKLKNSND